MPLVLLPILILALVAVAVYRMVGAVADLRTAGLERALADEELEVPDDLPDDPHAPWVHQRLMDAYAAEPEGWALEQVRRIDARLQAGIPEAERLETVVLWIPEATAFTMPGRHLYLSRRLQERAAGDEQVAMILAHEMAHHHLGHVGETGAILQRLPEPARALAADLLVARAFVLHGAEREAETDAHALNLCLAAGYDAHRCIGAFDLLEMLVLDQRDTEGVFGPDAAIQAQLDGEPEWMVSLRTWMWERRRGYPSLRERKARLLAAYEEAVAAAVAGSG